MSKILLIVLFFIVLFVPVYLIVTKVIPWLTRLISGTSKDDVKRILADRDALDKNIRREQDEIAKRSKELEQLERRNTTK